MEKMNLKIGIVGLPNVGKSTLFNALTNSKKAAAENFPFCTIEPNVGIVAVPDAQLEKIAEIVQPEKKIFSTVEFVDIAGLVAGASAGEGLGNKFLSHIRNCDAIAHVLRDFENSEIHHVDGKISPPKDFSTILTELILADLSSAENQILKITKKMRSGEKDAKKIFAFLEKTKKILNDGKIAAEIFDEISDDEKFFFEKNFQFLTAKKFLIIANVDEKNFANFDEKNFRDKIGVEKKIPIIPICAKLEADFLNFSDDEKKIFLAEIGAEKSGLENLIQKSFALLELENFFTAGKKEVRSWTIRKNSTAPRAAGEIHSDFERGFISADVISCADFLEFGGELAARDAGKLRNEGKNYIVKNGDVIHFKFNV